MRKLDPVKHEEKRREILNAAERCFVRDGLQGASISSICAEARISPGHLYHYFTSKEAIVSAMIEVRLEEAAAGLSAARPCSGYASIDRNLRQALCIGHARRRASLVHSGDGLPERRIIDKCSFDERIDRWITQRFPPGMIYGVGGDRR